MKIAREVEIRARRRERGLVAGYAVEFARPDRSLVVEAWIDGLQARATIADLFCQELADAGMASPRHGFAFTFAPAVLDGAERLEIRIANRDDAPGESVDLIQLAPAAAIPLGAVSWSGGLRFSGWIDSAGDETPLVRAFIDEMQVAEAFANRWRHIDPPDSRPRRGFDLHLPPRFADGKVGSVSLRADDGRELPGSPVTFWAAAEGLEATLAGLAATPGQRLQGAHFDRLLPNALPFAAYADHRAAFQPALAPRAAVNSWAVAVLSGDGLDATLETLEAQTLGDWTCLALRARQDAFSYDPQELGEFLASHADGADWLLFVLAGVRLDAQALARFDACAESHPDASLIYCDREIETETGALWPLALPAFDYERMLEQGYFAPAFALPRAAVETAVEIGVDNVFRLANWVFDSAGHETLALHLPGPAVRHRPSVLAGGAQRLQQASAEHLAARGLIAEVEALSEADVCWVKRRHARKPSVSIVIPTRDRGDLLRSCLESILAAVTTARTEIIVVDNETREPQTLDYLAEIGRYGVRVLSAPGPFNFARLNNFAAAEARGDYLCFLNNDVVAEDSQWLEEMLSRHADPNVGAVGAKLLWPGGGVQHGGVTLGVNFAPTHAFRDRLDDDPGYGGQLLSAHETGAVTAACMTTPRALFLDSGGFDALRFPVNFNDVDYCLRVAARGLRIVLTPHAKLQHRESASRGRDERSYAAQRFQRELRSLRELWGEAMIADLSYSPMLALSDPPYAALASPPRALAPRRRLTAPARTPPPGF